MTKHYLKILVSYESAGGMGEHDAIEEALRNTIERKEMSEEQIEVSDAHCPTCQCWKDGTEFTVEDMEPAEFTQIPLARMIERNKHCYFLLPLYFYRHLDTKKTALGRARMRRCYGEKAFVFKVVDKEQDKTGWVVYSTC
jgi:hypothetical protein